MKHSLWSSNFLGVVTALRPAARPLGGTNADPSPPPDRPDRLVGPVNFSMSIMDCKSQIITTTCAKSPRHLPNASTPEASGQGLPFP